MPNPDLSGRTICVVGTSTPNKQFVFETLKKLDLTVIVIEKEKNWATPFVDHWIIADTSDHLKTIKAFAAFTKEHPRTKINGIVNFWEEEVVLTSKLIEKFGFPGTPYPIVEHIRNKLAFRKFCSENNLPVPKHHRIRSTKDLDLVKENFTFPVVIKPAFGAGSAYVTKVSRRASLKPTIDRIRKKISPEVESTLSEGLDIFVEEFIDGAEVDIDMLVQNGKVKFCSVSDNYDKKFGNSFLDKGQALPSKLSKRRQDVLATMAEVTVEKLGITDACVHYEAKIGKKGPIPLEINLRLGGGCVHRSLMLAWGVDFVEYSTRIALGEYFSPIPKPKKPLRGSVSLNLQPPYSGTVTNIKIDPMFYKKSYFEELHLAKKVGDSISCPPHGFECLGWFTVSGSDLKQAEHNAREARKLITYEIKRSGNN